MYKIGQCLTDNVTGRMYQRITKQLARKLFNEGYTIRVLPCNVCFNNEWVSPINFNYTDVSDFDVFVNSYQYYNCCTDLGLYPSYFVACDVLH